MTRAPAQAQVPLWRWVLGYARRRRRGLAYLAGVMLAEAGLQALAPWPMMVLVNQVLYGHPSPLRRKRRSCTHSPYISDRPPRLSPLMRRRTFGSTE